MNALAVKNTENVGVPPALIWVVTVGPTADVHCPFWGFVWHKLRATGRVAFPSSAETVMLALAPTFDDATANAPLPTMFEILTIPSLLSVAERAITSGTGLVEAESRSVLTPTIVGAGLVLVPVKLNATSVGAIGAIGVMLITKVWEPLRPGMFTGVFGDPVNAFVCGSVV
jgi:hypothetical protein